MASGSLYSPVGWFSWADAAAMFAEAQKNPALLQVFVNTVLGETWALQGDAPEWQRLYDRREDYRIGTVPKGGLFQTAGVDIQKDRIEREARRCSQYLLSDRVRRGSAHCEVRDRFRLR